jgi:hypothetical protein
LGSSNASITILWFDPKNLKAVSIDPISSANEVSGEINSRSETNISRVITGPLRET